MGDPGGAYSQEPEVFPHIIRVSDVKASNESHAVMARQKRNTFFQSGLRLCGQETAEQVVSHHLSYFHLRGKIQVRQQEVKVKPFNKGW